MTLSKIMYVDDEPDIQAVVKLALEAVGGFQVELCNSGREALEKAPVLLPNLILLDVMMPDLDGISTLKELRKMPETKDIPVVFMTAKVQQHEIEQYKELGALDVICKPFDPMTLPQIIQEIWERKP